MLIVPLPLNHWNLCNQGHLCFQWQFHRVCWTVQLTTESYKMPLCSSQWGITKIRGCKTLFGIYFVYHVNEMTCWCKFSTSFVNNYWQRNSWPSIWYLSNTVEQSVLLFNSGVALLFSVLCIILLEGSGALWVLLLS